MELDFLNRRPVVVAIAGPNGSGKSTFYQSHLADTGLRFVNADVLAKELDIGPYEAADAAAAIRGALIASRESFIFETVFSDPVGDKVDLLTGLAQQGYEVVLIFIQIPNARTSIERVSMRVSQGGHDVPDEKLLSRFNRTQANLRRAIKQIPHVIIFDNSDLASPYRHVATYRDGSLTFGGGESFMVNRARVIGIHPILAEEPVHLVEIDIEGSAESFNFGEITQEVPGEPPSNWQTVYDEREVGQNRCAFFFHYLDTTKPLLSPAGPLALPPESPVPEHLQGIEYEPP